VSCTEPTTQHTATRATRASHTGRRRLRVLTWHVHGNYLYYLSQVPHEWHVLSRPGRPPGYAGRSGVLPWGDNVHDCPVETLQERAFDCILFQSRNHYLTDQHELLSAAQRRLPHIYLEHDPPQAHPTDTRHPAAGGEALVVHVTAYNALMWDCGAAPTAVIEHGVVVPDAIRYGGERERGVVVVNHLERRGRRLGFDLYRDVRGRVPLDLYGMDAERSGGVGELPYAALLERAAQYRFFFHPARYTSLGLAVCEAMMLGMPVVGLATTELPTVIRDGENGCIDTRVDRLVDAMHWLLRDPEAARALGAQARRDAMARFGIGRFVADWCRVLESVARREAAVP
jgi:hypothetical protein